MPTVPWRPTRIAAGGNTSGGARQATMRALFSRSGILVSMHVFLVLVAAVVALGLAVVSGWILRPAWVTRPILIILTTVLLVSTVALVVRGESFQSIERRRQPQ